MVQIYDKKPKTFLAYFLRTYKIAEHGKHVNLALSRPLDILRTDKTEKKIFF